MVIGYHALVLLLHTIPFISSFYLLSLMFASLSVWLSLFVVDYYCLTQSTRALYNSYDCCFYYYSYLYHKHCYCYDNNKYCYGSYNYCFSCLFCVMLLRRSPHIVSQRTPQGAPITPVVKDKGGPGLKILPEIFPYSFPETSPRSCQNHKRQGWNVPMLKTHPDHTLEKTVLGTFTHNKFDKFQ